MHAYGNIDIYANIFGSVYVYIYQYCAGGDGT